MGDGSAPRQMAAHHVIGRKVFIVHQAAFEE
jgi:hypothetical protein